MNVHNEVVYAILKASNWKLLNKNMVYSIVDNNSKHVIFVTNNAYYKYFFSIEDLYYTLKYNADVIYDSVSQYENPYIGLSDYEILLKCDLENCI